MTDHTIVLTTLDGESLSFSCGTEEDIISAAEKANIYLNAQCRDGACGACIAHHASGDYQLDSYSDDALSDSDRSSGRLLLCRTHPKSNMHLTLPYERDLVRSEKRVPRNAELVSKRYLTPDTVKLNLQLHADDEGNLSLEFEPGQFVQLSAPDSDISRPYSLANAPNWDGSLELVIKLRPNGAFSTWLDQIAVPGDSLRVEGPYGTFVLRDHGLRPRFFVAGGCGIASVMSMLRRMAEWQEPHPVKLFFGVRDESELFYQDELAQLAATYPNLRYQICLTQASVDWTDYRGSAVTALEEALVEFGNKPDVYVCGSPRLIQGVTEVVQRHGIPSERLIFEQFLASTSAPPVRCEIA